MIPPKKFYRMSREEQEETAIREFQKHNEMADAWKKLSVQARIKHIPNPDERPDELLLKAP